MLKYKTEIHDLKRDKIKKIESCLDNKRKGITEKFNPEYDFPIPEANVYLTLYFDVVDSTHRNGFVIDYNQALIPCGAKYFSSKGNSTYRESELNSDEFDIICEFYDLKSYDFANLIREKMKLL